jgi:hypothetical protein
MSEKLFKTFVALYNGYSSNVVQINAHLCCNSCFRRFDQICKSNDNAFMELEYNFEALNLYIFRSICMETSAVNSSLLSRHILLV